MTGQLTTALGVGLVGLLMIGLGLWLRAGRPEAMHRWMNPLSENWMAERVVLLGMPSVGALLVCLAVVAAPHQWTVLRLLAIAGMVVPAVPALYVLIAPLPLPGFLYPGWARRLRDGREAQMRAFLTGQG
ncbi:hypothetical protein HMPREF3159_09840 [Brachybacterium sp. HMSC06H03]|uniref:hypothetical protein n=1 Tax=Brachybacterium sp. HMSC06H03 TaxID=1581127 RepID=UPI0008A4593E|nr:hypothetical protein [Brachybacterium sp. HMSC06H03]OFT55670.1 hypothetical protein HMPREF3159_09840 [Brachybacterium sp. HMSC06H03]